MKNTQTSDIQIFESLRNALGFFGDETNVIYKSKFVDKNTGFVFNSSDDLLNSLHEFGFQGKTLKEAGFELEDWYELLRQQQTTVTDVPRPTGPEATTLTSGQFENFEKDIERQKKSEQIRADQGKVVSQTQDRLKEIYDQQRIIQEQIKKAQEIQPKFVGKKIYATVEQQSMIASLEVQKSFETLTGFAIYQETRTDLVEQLTENVQSKTNTEEIVARTIAVQLVNDISDSELAKEKIREVAIEEAIEQNKDNVLEQVLQKDEVLIEIAKKGAVLEAENMKGSVFLTREIAENILPLGVVEQIYGSKQIKVALSSEPSEQTTHEVDLEKSIRNYEINLKEQGKFLDSLKEDGIDGAKSIFRNQLYSNVNTYLTKAPKESALGKVYSSDAVKAILTKGSPNAFELKYFGSNKYLGKFLELSPDSMPYFKLFTEVTGVSVGVGTVSRIIPLTYGGGAIPLAKIAFIQPVKSLGVPYTLGVKTGAKFAVGKTAEQAAVKTGVLASFGSLMAKGAAAVGVSLGVFTAGVSTAITVATVAVGKLINWPKIKQWFMDNKEIFVFGGAGLGLFLGGPVAGLVTGGLLMAATGTLGTFAIGAFNLFGFIGRSVGIAIATPVIVTLLVLPPLVAFIMLVINNSAYVVPPGLSSSSSGADNPYMLVTKEATPTKLDNSSSPQTVIYLVTVKALKNNLTNLKIVGSECNVIKKDKTKVNCPTEVFPDVDPSQGVSPTQTYAFTFTGIYDGKYNDSLIYDSITFSAEVDGQTITTSGSASVCIGDCPANCAVVSDIAGKWPPNYRSNSETALGKLSGYQGFTAKLCPRNETVNLCYKPSEIDPGYYAWHAHNTNRDGCDVYFNEKGVSNDRDALFLITHELTHHIQKINGGETAKYLVSGGWIPELVGKGFCTYKDTAGSYTESMAEAAGLYTSIPSWGSCASNYKNMYPRNYSWAQGFMEK